MQVTTGVQVHQPDRLAALDWLSAGRTTGIEAWVINSHQNINMFFILPLALSLKIFI